MWADRNVRSAADNKAVIYHPLPHQLNNLVNKLYKIVAQKENLVTFVS